MMKKVLFALCALMATTTAAQAAQSWYEGNVANLSTGYDGSTVTFKLDNLEDGAVIDYTKCTCYSSWQKLCLDSTRATHDKEFTMLLSAQASGKKVRVIFDDAICSIRSVNIPGN